MKKIKTLISLHHGYDCRKLVKELANVHFLFLKRIRLAFGVMPQVSISEGRAEARSLLWHDDDDRYRSIFISATISKNSRIIREA